MKTTIVIPTYNEKENIEDLINFILDLNIEDLNILVADDNSPDGTGEIVLKISEKYPSVGLLSRKKKRGRGFAGIEGFLKAMSDGADYIIEMDADFSHHPRYIPDLLKKIPSCDIVIASRFIPGGMDEDRGLYRKIVTIMAGFYIRSLLNINIRDVSSGYRCFKREVFETIDLEDMISSGPPIVIEILYKARLKNFSIVEIPIIFKDRVRGKTKLDYITLLESLVMVLRLRQMHKKGFI
ncbi:MAG TPA: polyprenol monophosphomannose synthase [Candidatus Eremiobacteraeota bacterium]|nr:MAG: Undecaprenyl-phosphate mannosyltransferase [bacterium ADurb.Bin363]HPZ07923.1 polyprenol monophosphomannose synthase [Candidatus Eremiobacteraeota bacterium]